MTFRSLALHIAFGQQRGRVAWRHRRDALRHNTFAPRVPATASFDELLGAVKYRPAMALKSQRVPRGRVHAALR